MNYFSQQESTLLQEKALIARGAILKATTLAGSGHPGGSMSSIDILLTIYRIANINPTNQNEALRDRIVISNGHISPAVYSALAINEFFPLNDFISQFRLAGSIYEGHIERDTPGIEWSSGNLGQGLSAACGFALACKMKQIHNKVFVMMGDGEQQKGQLSEARRFAVKYKLHNITGIIDYNRLQIGGNIEHIMPQKIKENYLADGWEVIDIDGHDFQQIASALRKSESIDAPVMILANTVMGKGVSFMENKEKYHGAALNEEQLNDALTELNLPNDFEKYKLLRKEFKITTNEPHYIVPSLLSGKPRIYEKPIDNRSAWGNALADIAGVNKKEGFTPIAVFDCDLQGSVKTQDFESVLPDNFFQCGIAEHHTATIAGSVSIENIQTFFAGFGVFGIDETYNQHRLNDINNTNLKLIVTHVGLDVGEDGKTHQCVDYIGLMRNLYRFKIIVPVCPNQTDRVIRYISQREGNYLVAMGRSKVPVITKKDGTVYYDEKYIYEYGKSDLIREGNDGALLVTGSVAAKALEVVESLYAEGISLQLWAVSSPTLIDDECLDKASQTGVIFTYEDHNNITGLGCTVSEKLTNVKCKLYKFGVSDYCYSGKADDVYSYAGLDSNSITAKIKEFLQQK